MKLLRPSGQRCTFRVNCDQARQASLVIDIFPGMPQIFALQNTAPGVWETELRLLPGEYRFCYHLYDGRSLQYVTPADMETDGLKAVLRVKATSALAHENLAARPGSSRRTRVASRLSTRYEGGSQPTMLRRAAG